MYDEIFLILIFHLFCALSSLITPDKSPFPLFSVYYETPLIPQPPTRPTSQPKTSSLQFFPFLHPICTPGFTILNTCIWRIRFVNLISSLDFESRYHNHHYHLVVIILAHGREKFVWGYDPTGFFIAEEWG